MPDIKEKDGLKVFTDDDGLEYWSVRERQVDQTTAEYNTLGGSDQRACASCQWFINPAGCVVVESFPDPIVATGLSRFWLERVRPDTSMTPIPVTIVDLPEGQSSASGDAKDDKSQFTITVPRGLKAAMYSKINGILDAFMGKEAPSLEIGEGQSFIMSKDVNGEWRWFSWTSNNFRDRDNPPEIFSDAAHKDYIKYLDEGGQYPELWLWHEPGTRWGEADWADYADGFLMHSGTVDVGFEDVAIALSKAKDVGVSHGYHFLHSDQKKGIIGWYRDFEVSPLPMKAAANPWTGIEMLQKELGKMGFNKDKREGLVSLLGENTVSIFENMGKEKAAQLREQGVEFKGLDLFDNDAPADGDGLDATKDGAPKGDATADAAIDYKALGEEAAKALSELPAFKAITTGIETVQGEITGIKERLTALETSDDVKIAAALTPSVKAGTVNGGGYQASKANDNTIDADDPASKQGPDNAGGFFDEIVEQVAGPAQS